MLTYEPTEFLSKLSTDNLSDPNEVTMFGLVKADEEDPSIIHFSLSPMCDKWLSIPIEIVEKIDHLKTIPCKDHQHPLVRMKLKRPDPSRKDTIFLLQFISQMQHLLELATRAGRAQGETNASLSPRECYMVHGPEGLVICCYSGDGSELSCTGIAYRDHA